MRADALRGLERDRAPCPPGADTCATAGSTNALACACPAGFEFASAAACTPCAPEGARPASAARSELCCACPAGRFAVRAGAAACVLCSTSFFAASGGGAECQQCPEGEAASANRTHCEPVHGVAVPCATPGVRAAPAELPAFVHVNVE